jgi:hypothetical protein
MILVGTADNKTKDELAKIIEKISGIPVGVVNMGQPASNNSNINTDHNGDNSAAYFVSDENFKRYLELTKQKIK